MVDRTSADFYIIGCVGESEIVLNFLNIIIRCYMNGRKDHFLGKKEPLIKILFVNSRINDDVAHRDEREEVLDHGGHAGVHLL